MGDLNNDTYLDLAPTSSTGENEDTPNRKETTLRLLALRDKLTFDIENMPLDGFEFTYQQALREMKSQLADCETLLKEIEAL